MKTTKFKCMCCNSEFTKPIEVYAGQEIREPERELSAPGCPVCRSTYFKEQTREVMTKAELKQYQYLKRETENARTRLLAMERRQEDTSELYELIENNRLRCAALLLKTESFIFSIDDSLLRQIFEYRYVSGLSWAGVAARLGGYISDDCARIMHDRYLKSLEKVSAMDYNENNKP